MHILTCNTYNTHSFFFLKIYIFVLCVYVSSCVGMCIHAHVYTPRLGLQSPGTGVIGHCEPLCGSWETNPGLLLQQPVLVATEHLSGLHMLVWFCWVLDPGPHTWWQGLYIPEHWT